MSNNAESENFTPNTQGCDSILCKYNVTRDGDDAVSYKKAMQTLQSTLRKDKYDGNGIMAQNDPLYKNLSRCIGFFNSDKTRFPSQQKCKSLKSGDTSKPKATTSTFNQSRTSQPSANQGRREAPSYKIKELIENTTKLCKYKCDYFVRVMSYINNIKRNLEILKGIKNLPTSVSNSINTLILKTSQIQIRYNSILADTTTYRLHRKVLLEEVNKYLAFSKTGNNSFKQKQAKEDAKRAKEQQKQAKEDAKRAKEDAKRAKEQQKQAKEDAKRAKEDAKRAKEQQKQAKEDAKQAEKQAKEDAKRMKQAEKQAKDAEKQARETEKRAREVEKRAREEEIRARESEKRAREESEKRAREESARLREAERMKKMKQQHTNTKRNSSPPRNDSKKKRCPNGTRRNKKTGNCDAYNK